MFRYLDKLKEAINKELPNLISGINLDGQGEVEVVVEDVEPAWFRPEGQDAKAGVGSGKGRRGGRGSGNNILVKVPIEIVKQMIWDYLKLPNIKPRGDLEHELDHRLEGYTNRGPESRLDLYRTLYEIVASGGFMHDGVFRYRDMRIKKTPSFKAVVVFSRDKSGSITSDMVSTMNVASWWIMEWLRENYSHVETVYVLHDQEAEETDKTGFLFRVSNGGTVISTAFELIRKIFRERYDREGWNRYIIYFSDGDNAPDDVEKTMKIIDELSKEVELIGYGEVKNWEQEEDHYEDEDVVISKSKSSWEPSWETLLSELRRKYGPNGTKNIRYSELTLKKLWKWLSMCFSD